MTIAGSDSGGGAGIQADVKTFSALGIYGCTAITAVTAQNTRGVSRIFELPQEVISEQITSLLRDFSPDAIKIGMVYSRETIETVTKHLAGSKVPIVLDPILAAGTGARLLREDAFESLVTKLLPICTLVTPNRMEAERLAGTKITSQDEALKAARKIMKSGAKSVIVKGGHFSSQEVTDVLVEGRSTFTRFTNPRVDIEESHGSGCNFSAAVTAFLASGMALGEACRRANDYVHEAITRAVRVGKGLPVTNPLSKIYEDAMRFRVVDELQKAVEEVSVLKHFHRLIPETQTNFAYALPDAREASDVAAVRGRIVRIGNAAVPASYIEFGASKHVASAIIAYMRIQPSVRAAINIRHDDYLVRLCRNHYEVSSYDRMAEPAKIKSKEGSSVNWGTSQALAKNPKAEVIYHTGDIGREPMINIFGRTPGDVVEKIKTILKNYQ